MATQQDIPVGQPRSLAGQVAIVTGGGRGLGRLMATTLARAGMYVAVIARTAGELDDTVTVIEAGGGKAIALQSSVTDERAVQQMVEEVVKRLGPIDLLINNAGVVRPLGPIWEVDANEWWHCLDVNLRGVFLCTRAVVPAMLARQRGRILNIASVAGTVGYANGSAYQVSKTALIRFTEALNLETQPSNVLAFAVDPGTVRTAMSEYLAQSEAGQAWLPWYGRFFERETAEPVERLANLVIQIATGTTDPLSGRLIGVGDDISVLLERIAEIEQEKLYTLRLRKLQ